MRKLIALGVAAATASTLFSASSAFAACAVQNPTIGTVSSVVSSGDGLDSSITIANGAFFDASSFPTTSANIDAYNALATAYAQNQNKLPASYVPPVQSNQTMVGLTVPTQIYVPTAALSNASYHPGDIVIQGPPVGGACSSYGFLGFFGTNGTITSIVADDSHYRSYTYGSETLSVASSTSIAQSNCRQGNSLGSPLTCDTAITYSLGGTSFDLSPGQSHNISSSKFTQVNLINSTTATIPQNTFIEDFYPVYLEHTLLFTAPTMSDIQARIAALLALIKQLEDEINKIKNGTTTSSCTISLPTHDLSIGMSDSDVGGDITLLQQFLVSRGTTIYPEQLVTGFFGNATAAAVRRFQQANNVSPVSGLVGPLTRAAIQAVCSGTTPSDSTYSFSATPTSGTAPVSIAFTATNAEALDSGVDYVVDFGDGSQGTMTGVGTTANKFSVSHTYTTGGTFKVKLLQERKLCGSIVSFGCVADLQVDATSVSVSAPAPSDVCPNINGQQATMPDQMTKDASGNCVSTRPATVTLDLNSPTACTNGYCICYAGSAAYDSRGQSNERYICIQHGYKTVVSSSNDALGGAQGTAKSSGYAWGVGGTACGAAGQSCTPNYGGSICTSITCTDACAAAPCTNAEIFGQ